MIDSSQQVEAQSVNTGWLVAGSLAAWVNYWVFGRSIRAGLVTALISLVAALVAGALVDRDRSAVHAWLFVGATALLDSIHPMNVWLLNLIAPLVLYGLIVTFNPTLRLSAPRISFGTIDRATFVTIPFAIVATGLALVVWAYWSRPDLSLFRRYFTSYPVALVIVGGIGFAIINALFEEILFRGMFLYWLDRGFGPTWISIVIQGVAFGLNHWRGFPSGPVGAIMVAMWGIGLGILRRRTRGLAAPLIVHVAADATIFVITFVWVQLSSY